jgi:hypothetical protein
MPELISFLKFLQILNESGFYPKPLTEQELRGNCKTVRGNLFCSVTFENHAQATNFWKYIREVHDVTSPEPARNSKVVKVQLINE